jgi:flagellar motor switch protein FliN/FliY
MAEAIASETGSPAKPAAPPVEGTAPVDLPDFAGGNGKATTLELDKLQMLEDVQLQVRIELGRTRMLVQDVLRLDQGSVVELDKLAGDPVDIYVNERLVARGEVLVLNDNFCVRVNEIVSSPQETMA